MAYSYYYSGNGSYTGTNSIEVKKGSPASSKYAIFYAIDEDPVIFCKTWAATKKELKKLKCNEDVKQKSIRVFKLVNA